MKRANLVGKDTFAEQKVLIKAYLKVVKAKEICQEVNLSNTTISELKNGRKSLDTLKFRSFEALYIAAKNILRLKENKTGGFYVKKYIKNVYGSAISP